MPPAKSRSATRQVELSIRNPDGVGLEVIFTLRPDLGNSVDGATNANGDASLAVPGTVVGGASVLVPPQHGYQLYEGRGVLPLNDGPLEPAIHIVEPEIVAPEPPHPPEGRQVLRSGDAFMTSDGVVWSHRGASMFLLFARYRRGEDISPQVAWMKSIGVNRPRVFGRLHFAGWEDFWYPEDDPSYWGQAVDFLRLLQGEGLQCEWTIITGQENGHANLAQQQTIVAQSFETFTGEWNCAIEVVNEPGIHGKADAATLLNGCNRYGLLTSSGAYPVDGQGNWGEQGTLVIDCVGPHLVRVTPDRKYARQSKDLYEMREALGCPVFGDEPVGIAETEQPGRRTTHREDTMSHFGIATLLASGCTYHSDCGIDAIVPPPGSVQATIAEGVRDMWQHVPAGACLGQYSAPHLAGFPLVYKDGDSLVDHAYASILGDEAWAVIPAPASGTLLTAAPGWEITDTLENLAYTLRRI